jgi:hypothetical protein
MAYSKAKLKSNGDRASPCFKPFLIGNISDKFLPTPTLLYVSVRILQYIVKKLQNLNSKGLSGRNSLVIYM